MDKNRVVKNISDKPEGRRKVERPRLRWLGMWKKIRQHKSQKDEDRRQ